jgi:hypothetical protein
VSITVPIALFGWLLLTIIFFIGRKQPHHAILLSVIGGVLFLPMATFDHIPGLPPFGKAAAISIGLILGGRISGHRQAANFHWNRYDLPMLIWCLFCPFATSFANDLGWYNGLSVFWKNLMLFGIPYLAGRVYFDSTDKLRDLCYGLLIGGLIYLPLCLYEIRMSPQLSNIFYGFFPHSFLQHFRYGGFRPIVFMQHGLMVALWMAFATTVAFWFWRSGELKHVKGLPISIVVVGLAVTTVLCKSANGWITLFLGCGAYFVYRLVNTVWPFRLLVLLFPFYSLARITLFLKAEDVQSLAAQVFGAERLASLSIRLLQEDLFVKKTLERFWLGWDGYNRGWPTDPNTGERLIGMIDSLWLILFNTWGALGLMTFSAGMLVGPWLVLRLFQKKNFSPSISMVSPILLSLLVILFMIDTLVNSMVNQVYMLISGALLGWVTNQKTIQNEF